MANFNIDYLVIAGGGAGGVIGGGGGAGGFRTSFGTGNINGGLTTVETSQNLTTNTPYTLIVGAGGIATNTPGSSGPGGTSGSGGNSSFAGATTVLCTGGGGGGNYANGVGGSGGSGGGGSSRGSSIAGGSRVTTPVQGFNGGNNNSSSPYPAGGGGGAARAGVANTSAGSTSGGTALASSITGTPILYAGGGGGGYQSYYSGSINISGGGGGASDGAASDNATNAIANTGSGGGGGGFGTNLYYGKGGNGGSGIVILRYATADANYTTTGSTPTEDTTTIPGQTILSFTTVGTGIITFTVPPPPPPTPFDGTKVTNPVTGFNKTGTSEGLKLPSGDNSNQPVGALAEQGMIRNDTEETVDSSASAIAHYNGTNWQYFAATESAVPLVYSTFAAWDVGNTISYGGTGNTLYNIVNNPTGFNFTKYGGVSYDGVNKSFNFNGATGSNGAYMRFPQNAMNIPTGFTVSMWVNFTAFPTITTLYAYGYSPSLRQQLSSTQMRYYVTPGPGGNYTPYFNHGMTTGNWYNITMVINNSNAISPTTIKTYISQEGDSTATLKQTVNTNHGAHQNTNQLYFGCNVQNYNANFNGQLRVMEIYNSELNQTDIDFIVNQGSQQ